MSGNTDDLREIFLDVSEDGTVTERQREAVSHDPVEEEEARVEAAVAEAAREDGLVDAIEGPEPSDQPA